MDITLVKNNRIVLDLNGADIYYQRPISVGNFRGISINNITTVSGGNIIVATLPSGLDLFNRGIGSAGVLNLTTTSGELISKVNLESNLRRTDIMISGTKNIFNGV